MSHWYDLHSCQALQWQASRTAEQVIAEREAMISALEEANTRMWESGVGDRWLSEAPRSVRNVAEGVNGHLLQQLLAVTGHPDEDLPLLFKHGAVCFT